MKGALFQRVEVPPRQGSSRPGSHPNGGSPNNTLASYEYNGAGRIVIEDFEQPDVRLDYYDDYDGAPTAGTYEGLDRFGRVQQQVWRDYDAPAYVDHFTYDYDYNSNRLYRENELEGTLGELYHTNDAADQAAYDGLDRLKEFRRGTLDDPPNSIADGNTGRRQVFTLDQVGNWDGFKDDEGPGDGGGGAWDLNQTRTQNDANEITGITENPGDEWADPAYSARGNMTSVPDPSDLTDTYACRYDAWNRLVEVKSGETVVAKYEYDGTGRRIKAHIDAQAPAEPNGVDHYRHFFYNASWQILETRKATSPEAQPEGEDPEFQYVWSLRYLDAPVLRDENKDSDDDCINGDDERLYYTTDANMNVTALLEDDGTVVERYVYDPYGQVTIYDDDWSETRSTSSYDNNILYCGYYHDWETGLYHVRNRVYHPHLGAWLQRDPLGYVDGMSLYEYCASGPLGWLDPFGLISRDAVKEIQRYANAYNDAQRTAKESEEVAERVEQRAEDLERQAEKAEKRGDLAKKKELLGKADEMRRQAERCRENAADARQAMEEAAWQAKIAIERAEWAERGTTGGGGDAYGWKRGVKDYGNPRAEDDPSYADLAVSAVGKKEEKGSSVLDYIRGALELAGLAEGPCNPLNPLNKALNDLVQDASRPENLLWIAHGMVLGTRIETPGIPVPGGVQWRGGTKGAWFYPKTGESYSPHYPDATHLKFHVDYTNRLTGEKLWIYPDGRMIPKP